MPSVAVVILNYNGIDHLRMFMPSVLKNTPPSISIVIGDNCSTDQSIDYVRREYPSVRIIENEKNFGFAEGYNRVLKQVDADYYVLLNSDVEVTPNWVMPIITLMESDLQIAACSPKIKSYKKKDFFEHAGAAGGFIDKYGFPFCKGRVFDSVEVDTGQYDGDCEVFWCSGAAMIVRSHLFWKGEGFDADFFAHMEEIDWCWRVKNMGYKIMSSSRSCVYHLGGGTLAYVSPFKTYLNFRNNLSMLYKNASSPNLLVFKRRLIDAVAAVKFLLTGDFANFRAVWRGHRDFSKQKKTLIAKRKRFLGAHTHFAYSGVLNANLVVEYYVRNKKKFSDLASKIIS